MKSIKVALIHDWLTGMRGGERCLEIFCELFPQAVIYTLLHIRGSVSPLIEKTPIKTSFIQNLPFSKSFYRKYLPLFPMAIESFNFKGYELILSLSHCVAKGVIPPPEACTISYLFTPMRYAWDMYGEYFGGKRNLVIPFFMHYLRMWDVNSSTRVDHFLCISEHVKNRIKKFYRREADIIFPPVDVNRFRLSEKKEDFFLIVSSLVPYKRTDLAIEAFTRLKYPLKIIGTGPERKRLQSKAGSHIEFLGWQPDDVVAEFYSHCRGLIFPGEEDFGIVPVEAMACGKPIIAYGRGGALETIIPYEQPNKTNQAFPTGVFFHEPNIDSLIEGVERFIKIEKDFNPGAIRKHSLQWDREIFKEKMKNKIEEILIAGGYKTTATGDRDVKRTET